MNLSSSHKNLLALSLVAGTVLLRVMPHVPNFSATNALALFAFAFFGFRAASLLLVVGVQAAGDLCLAALHGDLEYGFHSTSASNYLALVLIALLGYPLSRKVTWVRTVPFALAASATFFLVTNFHCWLVMDKFSNDWSGLMECYRDGIPFYGMTLKSDLCFSLAFCGLALALAKAPARQGVELR